MDAAQVHAMLALASGCRIETGAWRLEPLGLRDWLLAGDRAVVQALHGMGGVGKTQLAIEYAHRFAEAASDAPCRRR